MSFHCEKCGACCRYHNCKYLQDDNLCSIYDTRPLRCNVHDMWGEDPDVHKNIKLACGMLRLREQLNESCKLLFDSKYEGEREGF